MASVSCASVTHCRTSNEVTTSKVAGANGTWVMLARATRRPPCVRAKRSPPGVRSKPKASQRERKRSRLVPVPQPQSSSRAAGRPARA